MDSSQNSSWEVSLQRLDPIQDSISYLKGDRNFRLQTREYSVPGSYPDELSKTNTGYLVKRFIAPVYWKASGIAIRLGTISDKDRTYLNGTLIGQTGDFSSEDPQAYDKIRIYSVPSDLIRKGKENLIVIEVKGYFPNRLGIEQDRTEIGDSAVVFKNFFDTEHLKLGFLIVYLTVGFFFLFLYLRKRSSKENFYYGLFTILLVIYQFLRNQAKYDIGLELIYLKKIEYISVAFMMPVGFRFIRFYFRYPKTKFTNALDISFLGIGFFYLFSNDVNLNGRINKNLVQFLYLPYVVYMFYYLIKRLIEKEKDALLILLALLVVIIASTVDALTARELIVFPRLLGYAFFVFIMSVATILANRYVSLNRMVEDLNNDFEKKATQRTQELNDSLTEVQNLKVQQDVEEADGNLEEINNSISSLGELTDDFTLLRISYIPILESNGLSGLDYFREDLESAKTFFRTNEVRKGIEILENLLKLKSENEELLHLLGKAYIKEKQFVRAENCFEIIVLNRPDSTESLYYLSYCAKLNRRYSEAVDAALKLLSLDPDHLRNLINLADLYKILREFHLAEAVVNRALSIAPNNQNALKILDSVRIGLRPI
ncbi:7TM diverse intracellular signaling domain-containing protein [Leptospira ainazelensis]|uniref:7TM diverse intracellular signaling domain-containing protein n=1 Tax=Leptospira ainazelensis TaxID=2810034 RepID=UPI001E48D304|nr:7TM diverse intracellular signaling domain-containing protein [Leptospira ainazelensis]